MLASYHTYIHHIIIIILYIHHIIIITQHYKIIQNITWLFYFAHYYTLYIIHHHHYHPHHHYHYHYHPHYHNNNNNYNYTITQHIQNIQYLTAITFNPGDSKASYRDCNSIPSLIYHDPYSYKGR